MTVEMVVLMAMIFLFVLLGIVFRAGKGASLIAGYNTMSEEEKAKINEEELLKTMGNMSFNLTIPILLWLLSSRYEREDLFYSGLVLFILLVFGTIIYVNLARRFKR